MNIPKYNFFKIDEIKKYKFYQVPKELFTNELYNKNLSLTAKIIYSFLLDRLELSRKNKWINNRRELYLIFTREEISKLLNISVNTTIKAFKELKSIKLIYEKREVPSRPYYIYISKLVENTCDTLNNLNYIHEKSSVIELNKFKLINTYNNKNNINNKRFQNQREYSEEFLESFYDNI